MTSCILSLHCCLFIHLGCSWNPSFNFFMEDCEVKWKLFSCVWLSAAPWTRQSMEFSRPKYWKWVTFPFPRESSQPRDWTQVSHIVGRLFTSWATREACKPLYSGESKHNYFLIKLIVTSIPGTEEPGGLPSVGSHRVGHDWSNLAAAAAYKYRPLNIDP